MVVTMESDSETEAAAAFVVMSNEYNKKEKLLEGRHLLLLLHSLFVDIVKEVKTFAESPLKT